MKILSLVLTALVILLQYPLWLGKGGWFKVWEVDQQITGQHETNRKLQARNAALDAEVRDLKQGYDAIEERARNELGMIKQNEIFFHMLEDSGGNSPR
ncbi:MAG: cell division protein FtsB [Betaproteobacteria bacterium]|nr:cell division protein FtsB [Betaproteobacteria bacterium]